MTARTPDLAEGTERVERLDATRPAEQLTASSCQPAAGVRLPFARRPCCIRHASGRPLPLDRHRPSIPRRFEGNNRTHRNAAEAERMHTKGTPALVFFGGSRCLRKLYVAETTSTDSV